MYILNVQYLELDISTTYAFSYLIIGTEIWTRVDLECQTFILQEALGIIDKGWGKDLAD